MPPGDTTAEFVRRCRHCGSPLSATSSFCSKCGATAEAPTAASGALREQVQALFGVELDLEREIGRGGMAAVYAGFDPALHRRVAVKVLLPEIANDRSAADRFLREARTVASLQHPHVVTVYAVKSRDGVHAIVMQLVDGRSLDAVLQEREAIPVHVAGMLLAQVADGLQHAHDRGVIHRDVKPANVLIDHDGRAIVSDFGIARRDSGPRTTETGLVVGTWAYMSPEQRSADSVTSATDQYALGVMAFELLTGQLPFNGTPSEVLHAHLHAPPPSIRALRPDVSQAVDAVVQRMMAKDPAARFPSLRDVERTFRTLVPDEGKTTLQLAAFSHLQPAKGSQVIAAAAVAAAASPPGSATHAASMAARAAPTARAADMGTAPARSPVPARSRWGVAAGIVGGLAVLGIVWAIIPGRSPNGGAPPLATGDPGAAQASQPSPPAAGAPVLDPGAAVPSAQDSAPRGARPTGAPDQRLGGGVEMGTQIAPAPIATPKQDALPRAAVPNLPGADTAARAAPPAERTAAPPRTEPPPAAVPPGGPAATTADARRLGREFVTMLNQRRTRELAQLPQIGGDAAARAELIRLAESSADFAAGFDRLPSAPGEWTRGFETEFDLDLEWRGGRKLFRVRLYASPGDTGWRTVGIAVEPAGGQG